MMLLYNPYQVAESCWNSIEAVSQNAGKPDSSKLSFGQVFIQRERLQTSPCTWENMISVLCSPAVGKANLANILSAMHGTS